MKKHLITLLVLMVVSFSAYTVYKQITGNTQNGDPVAIIDTPARYVHADETEDYIIKIDIEQTGDTYIDQSIRSDVEQKVGDFVAEVNRMGIPAPDSTVVQKWSASWKGDVASRAGTVINYRLDGYEYTGGAHGNPSVNTTVWDTFTESTPTPIRMTDIFITDTNYLATLSDVSRKLLLAGKVVDSETSQMIADNPSLYFTVDQIADGTSVDPENFQNFALEHAGIRIIFNAYQVGPYALGQPEIIIPWDAVKDIVNPDILERVHSS